MRNLPRFALVPLAALVSVVPFASASFVGPAGADTASDCEAAFSTAADTGLVYTTDPATRLAYSGQTVRLSGSWDPAAWDSLSSAVACVRFDDTFDDVLGTSQPVPDNGGVFEHSFTIPETAPGTRLCTRIRLAGDPAGEATEAVKVTKMHCFEVDHDEEEAPPADDDTTTPTTSAPSTTTTTVPTAAPATSTGTPSDDTPAGGTPDAPFSPDGGGSPVGTPFDTAEAAPPGAPGSSLGWPETGAAPLLPATGNGSASLTLFRHGGLALFAGLALLVAFGLPRRRPRSTS
jgi:hypothetical protein